MKDLLIFNKDRDIVKIINKVNTIEARYSLAEATANRINLKHKKVIIIFQILCFFDL